MPVSRLQGQVIVAERVRKLLDYPSHLLRQIDEGSSFSAAAAKMSASTSPAGCGSENDRGAESAGFPALKEAPIARMWAAARVMSPDGLPVCVQSERCPGAFAASCHSGVTLAGAHALTLARAILRRVPPDLLAAFTSRRFSASTDAQPCGLSAPDACRYR
jgi:hydrogen cyanide synthase HcnC